MQSARYWNSQSFCPSELFTLDLFIMRYPVMKLTKILSWYVLDTIILFGYSFLKGFAEDLSQFPDDSFDAVIETLVLCSVNNVEKSLQEIQRVLKPGGVFCFLDHVKGPESTWLVTIQNFLTSTVSQYWNSIFFSNQPEQKFLKRYQQLWFQNWRNVLYL